MQLWIIGITCLSGLGNFIPVIETTPLGSSFGSLGSLRPNEEQHAEFGEGIRDWFKNLKNRIFGGTNDRQALPPTDAGKMMLELENEDLQDRKRNPGGFFLDLSNLTFDPENDWGFRLGQWYFIRKPNENSDDWKLSQPTYPEWSIAEGRDDENMLPPIITMRPNNNDDATTPSKESPEVTEAAETPEINDEDNETRNSRDDDRSTEVLSPSE